MRYKLDPELVPALAALAAQAAGTPRPARGDWEAVRAAASAGPAHMEAEVTLQLQPYRRRVIVHARRLER